VGSNDGVTTGIYGDFTPIDSDIPIFPLPYDAGVCRFNFFFAPTYHIIYTQTQIIPDPFGSQASGMQFFQIYK